MCLRLNLALAAELLAPLQEELGFSPYADRILHGETAGASQWAVDALRAVDATTAH